MFDALDRKPDDPLLALIGLFRKDERTGKVDLGVGVYRDETGRTPIFRAVKAAEKRLPETQDSKAQIGPEGDLVFLDRFWELVGGDTIERSHVAGHAPIFKAAGLNIATYDFFKRPSQSLIFDNLVTALEGARPADAVLLHASCHTRPAAS